MEEDIRYEEALERRWVTAVQLCGGGNGLAGKECEGSCFGQCGVGDSRGGEWTGSGSEWAHKSGGLVSGWGRVLGERGVRCRRCCSER